MKNALALGPPPGLANAIDQGAPTPPTEMTVRIVGPHTTDPTIYQVVRCGSGDCRSSSACHHSDSGVTGIHYRKTWSPPSHTNHRRPRLHRLRGVQRHDMEVYHGQEITSFRTHHRARHPDRWCAVFDASRSGPGSTIRFDRSPLFVPRIILKRRRDTTGWCFSSMVPCRCLR